MRFFEPYFFSKADQKLASNVVPSTAQEKQAVALLYDCLAKGVNQALAGKESRRIGILLSGGVDSSLLLALVNQQTSTTAAMCLTAYTDMHDKDMFPSKEVSHHFGNQWVHCKITKDYLHEHLPEALELAQAGLYITAHNIVLIRCLEACQHHGITELWLGSGLDMMFGGGVDPIAFPHTSNDRQGFHNDFWEHSMPLLLNRFYKLGSPDIAALATRYRISIVQPFERLETILCARSMWAPLFFKGTYDKYPVRLLARALGIPQREAFRPKRTLQESSGIFDLLEAYMFEHVAPLVPDRVSATHTAAEIAHDSRLALRLYLALKYAQAKQKL